MSDDSDQAVAKITDFGLASFLPPNVRSTQ